MGANILANMIGYEGSKCFLEAACIVNAPIKMWECEPAIRTSLFGAYNRGMGKNLNQLLIRNEEILSKRFKEAVGTDIQTYLRTHEHSILDFD